ncbi:MAG: hypothetical protein DDT28_00056 [Dehalococcoidia bacterium]|nr:hypothetical protein [Chloroflexota bacterium]
MSDDSLSLGNPGLKELLDPGKTANDIQPGHSPGVKGAHSELCPWLTDALSSNDAYGYVLIHYLPSSEVDAIAILADALPRPASQR